MIHRLLTVAIATEMDVVAARQRARQIVELLGFEGQDRTRLVTAVSEIARNALEHGKGGKADFTLEGAPPEQVLVVTIADRGPGVADLDLALAGRSSGKGLGVGLSGAARLVDDLKVESAAGKGTVVRLQKALPRRGTAVRAPELKRIAEVLAASAPADPATEVREQNKELIQSLSELQRGHEQLGHLNRELEDTNRGVVALYAELEERAEQLRRASEHKSRFLSNVSHELRTPLNSILALSRLLLDRTDGELSTEQEKQVVFIRKAAENLTELVNDLLDLARIEAGKTQVKVSEFTVESLFGALRGLLRPLLAGRTVDLSFEPIDDLPFVSSDEGKVSQILRNLISNAIKFTEEGEVRVGATWWPDRNEVVLSVSDSGIGISESDLRNIFEEFYQATTPLHARNKGTGLGLPLSKKLAELLGGRIEVESERGKGSTFSLIIPTRYREPRPQFDEAAAPRRVLLIDDEDTARYLVRQFLKAEPVTLREARSGEEGLRMARESPPDCVLLDLTMPGLDGFDVFERMRAENAATPVVVVTSRLLEPADRRRLDGVHAVVSKQELSRDMLVGVIQTAVEARP